MSYTRAGTKVSTGWRDWVQGVCGGSGAPDTIAPVISWAGAVATHDVTHYAETRTIWNGERSRRLPGDIQVVALRKLRLLSAAKCLDDLRVPPGNRLEALQGDRAGQHSIRVYDQWRICFRWSEGGPADVEIVDYHR